MSVKQFLLTTPFGSSVRDARSVLQILRTVFVKCEFVGALANDHVATKLVTAIVAPGKTFVDVGAHIGSIVAAVLHHVPRAKIVAIEAEPKKARALERHFPSVKVHACAVGSSTASVAFYVIPNDSGYNSLLVPVGHDGAVNHQMQEIQVPMRTLDDVLTADDVDVIKIDVEGAEIDVLLGAAQVIARCRPLVMLESGTPRGDGPWETIDRVHAYFQAIDYDMVLPNHLAHHSPGLDVAAYRQGHWHPRVTTNYFAVPAERRNEFRSRARSILGLPDDVD